MQKFIVMLLVSLAGFSFLSVRRVAGESVLQPDIPPCTFVNSYNHIEISHDNQWVLTSDLGEALLWNIHTGELEQRFSYEDPYTLITDIAFSPDDRLVATSVYGEARLWYRSTGIVARKFPVPAAFPQNTYVDFFSNGRRLLVSNGEGAYLWDLVTDRKRMYFPGSMESRFRHRARLSPDDEYVLTTNGGGSIREATVWDTRVGQVRWTFDQIRIAQMPISFIPEAPGTFAVNEGDALTLWNSGYRTGSLVFGAGRTEEWQFSPNGKYVLVLRDVGVKYWVYSVELWDVEARTKLYTFAPSHTLERFLFLPDGESLLTLRWNEAAAHYDISIWNAAADGFVRSFAFGSGQFITSAVTSDSRYWVAATEDSRISVWDLQTGTFVHNLCEPV